MRDEHGAGPGPRGARAGYRDLVRLAYFVLPGTGSRVYRLAMARRIVEVTGARGGHARRRTRVLRRAMRPSRRWRIGLGPWLRAAPPRLPDPAATTALAALEPPVRVACVLLSVARTPRYAVRDQLVALGVRDPWPVIEAAGAAADRVFPGDPQRPGTDPFGPVRRPVRHRPPVPAGVAFVLTAGLLGVMVVSESGGRAPLGGTSSAAARDARLLSAAPDAWRRAPRGLDVWPARGDLTGDAAFRERALRAWTAATRAGGAGREGDPQLLFAGRVDGRPVALLRRGDKVGRFTGPDGPLTLSAAGTDAEAPMALGGGRYLLAPWERAETLTGRKVALRHGVTEPVTPRTPCGRGPLFHLKGTDGGRTVGEFGGPRPVTVTYRPPSSKYASAGHESGPGARDASRPPTELKIDGLRVWDRVACLTPIPARPVAAATAWEFWSGVLPKGGGRAQWVCAGMAFAGGGTAAQGTLLDKDKAHDTGWCDDRRPAGGTWWRSARGDWYYLAAAARGLVPRAEGPLRRSKVSERLLTAVPAGPADRRPAGPVTVSTRPA
ncbi:hypothetical protein GCM10023085_00370 [Actinomadura viridis]|uniref:DNA-directed RNA polymerase specialized sigma24 family protein n=1 Tax=Actinomadura viridis TaxID=58110 RepID=A0A931GKY3_9ACTN|nr:hypothetical protein [Actinomadura viridis]MBG6090857.1 hypothetical protein [Actinomadura viridis]